MRCRFRCGGAAPEDIIDMCLYAITMQDRSSPSSGGDSLFIVFETQSATVSARAPSLQVEMGPSLQSAAFTSSEDLAQPEGNENDRRHVPEFDLPVVLSDHLPTNSGMVDLADGDILLGTRDTGHGTQDTGHGTRDMGHIWIYTPIYIYMIHVDTQPFHSSPC